MCIIFNGTEHSVTGEVNLSIEKMKGEHVLRQKFLQSQVMHPLLVLLHLCHLLQWYELSRHRPCGICGTQSVTGTGFAHSTYDILDMSKVSGMTDWIE
jgi:hypothetical protein